MDGGKIYIPVPVVVEGKYDKIKLSQVIDANIVVTDGFGVFKKAEKTALLRRLADKNGIAVLTDSDRGGSQIRAYLSSIIAPDKLYHLYIPQIEGKERRKRTPSAAGTLGVEGIDEDILRGIFRVFAERIGALGIKGKQNGGEITKAMLYSHGLTGEGSAAARDAMCLRLGLPSGMGASAFMKACQTLMTAEEFENLAESVRRQA